MLRVLQRICGTFIAQRPRILDQKTLKNGMIVLLLPMCTTLPTCPYEYRPGPSDKKDRMHTSIHTYTGMPHPTCDATLDPPFLSPGHTNQRRGPPYTRPSPGRIDRLVSGKEDRNHVKSDYTL